MTSVLLLGATGHLGAHFLTVLRKTRPGVQVTAYLRSSDSPAAQDVTKLGVKIVNGTFQETQKLADLSAEYPIVINAADSTDNNLTAAIVEGLNNHKGPKPTLVHVSGAGNFLDGGKDGKLNPGSKVWNDKSEDDIRAIHPGMKNGGPDAIILKAAEKGTFNAAIISPVGIHGLGKTDIRTKSLGAIINWTTQNATQLGFSPYIGDGSAVFQMAHIDDVVSFMMVIFDKALNGDFNGSPYSNYYVTGGPEHTWKELATAIAQTLHAKGKISSSEARSVSLEEAGFLAQLYGANLFVKDDNARSLGYQNHGPSVFESLKSVYWTD